MGPGNQGALRGPSDGDAPFRSCAGRFFGASYAGCPRWSMCKAKLGSIRGLRESSTRMIRNPLVMALKGKTGGFEETLTLDRRFSWLSLHSGAVHLPKRFWSLFADPWISQREQEVLRGFPGNRQQDQFNASLHAGQGLCPVLAVEACLRVSTLQCGILRLCVLWAMLLAFLFLSNS